MPLDRRTRRNADLRQLAPSEFFAHQVPDLIARNGRLVSDGIQAQGAPPLALEVGGSAWTFASVGRGLAVTEGIAPDAFVITLDEAQFSDVAQNQISFNGLNVAQELRTRAGAQRDISVWDSLWLTLLEGWPTVDDGLEFLDRNGLPLDFAQNFAPDDDPADIAHFLREAGFLHLRGWLDPNDMATIAADIDRALPQYVHGDGRSWWATVADGTLRCVRLQHFVDHSPTTVAILESDRWDQLRRTLGGSDELVQAPVEGNIIEALIKPVGVVAGASDLSFHRDCHLGRHAYGCSGTTVGVSVTGSDAGNGLLRVVAGSHRVVMPVEIAMSDPYLPVVALATEPGDSDGASVLHAARGDRPATHERRVMYTGFHLAPLPDDTADGGRALSELRERAPDIVLASSGSGS